MAKNYSSAEKTAYYSGMGYAVAYHGRKINFGNEMMRKAPSKYPPLGKKK